MKTLLPIGSIVLLKDSNKKLMIIGRLQRELESKSENQWDYSACLYPEGNLRPESSLLFNHEQIERVYFIGFQDEEELEYNKKISKYINKNI
ncbi:DUF4176 domain-containing protein [Clostridium botulinum]|uniref:DUF4176 domain-containing protein n=1 Tax=Clostridium botulinum TaxID=1491 RepID=UPI0013FBB114|nr:DUF4176 domain-containing protein [Clostridium botulinum]NFN93483.1 DUF4176 domain-containing protein [Clostridium botulinum]NFS97711.1 DUF4176 domain-containing protein [Clostridium botulinum]UZP04985.1 DUF4176 domain-containing protein [Clostridium botulinum]UZP08395.1 DUF4176 domain-containing protein [Clostridium botulinum]UZP11723.1 DUF4176 domain-containing protein [Clostridium botulinum]